MSAWPTSVVGIPTPTESVDSGVRTVAAWARTNELTAADAVAAWAETLANSRGASLLDAGLRLFDSRLPGGCPVVTGRPSDLGHLYETMLAGDVRKRGGVHLTPADVAERLVALLDPAWMRPGARVLDPSVGGGAFLLAAADALVAAGTAPSLAVLGMYGIDHDPMAVAVAEAALSLWRLQHGLDVGPIDGLTAGDGLLDVLPACDVALGNPPFLNQLRTHSANAGARRDDLRARWGDLVTAYTDEAWLFLAAALDAVAEGGQLVMIQPVSVLAARHGEAVREHLVSAASLEGLWVSDGKVFDASVEVCAPVLRRAQAGDAAETRPLRRWRGRDFESLASNAASDAATSQTAAEWGRLGAAIAGIPTVTLVPTSETVGSVATVTAGFRDQFYGLAPYVYEADAAEIDSADHRRLGTVGMLDPFRFRWGSEPFRFAGEKYTAPVLDAAALEAADPELGRWVEARRHPKVLVATQTRVIEAWVDVVGDVIPATPTISVEPHDASDAETLWRLAALLMTPAITADVAAACFGTALSIRALKVSARDLAALPLPEDRGAWAEGAALAHEIQAVIAADEPLDETLVVDFAAAMHRSLGVSSEGITPWWRAGWPRR